MAMLVQAGGMGVSQYTTRTTIHRNPKTMNAGGRRSRNCCTCASPRYPHKAPGGSGAGAQTTVVENLPKFVPPSPVPSTAPKPSTKKKGNLNRAGAPEYWSYQFSPSSYQSPGSYKSPGNYKVPFQYGPESGYGGGGGGAGGRGGGGGWGGGGSGDEWSRMRSLTGLYGAMLIALGLAGFVLKKSTKSALYGGGLGASFVYLATVVFHTKPALAVHAAFGTERTLTHLLILESRPSLARAFQTRLVPTLTSMILSELRCEFSFGPVRSSPRSSPDRHAWASLRASLREDEEVRPVPCRLRLKRVHGGAVRNEIGEHEGDESIGARD